jgi:hypothetical protein
MDKGRSDDRLSLGSLAKEAEEFLLSHSWCSSVRNAYFGIGNEGIFAVFLFEIVPACENVDEFLWVVTGDLPPAYLVCDSSPDPPSALRNYIAEMRTWVETVQEGRTPGEDVIPVNAPPTREFAEMLQSRLDFLEGKILPQYEQGT